MGDNRADIMKLLETLSDKINFIHSKYEIDSTNSAIIGEKKPDWVDWLETDEFKDFVDDSFGKKTDNKTTSKKIKDGKKFLQENYVIVISIAVLILVLVVCVICGLTYIGLFKCCNLKNICCTNCCIKIPDENIFALDRVLIDSGLKLEPSLPTKTESEAKRWSLEVHRPSPPESVYNESECIFDRISARWTALERAGLITFPIQSEQTVSLPNMSLKMENEEFKYFESRKKVVRPPLKDRTLVKPRSLLEPIYENPYENAHMVEIQTKIKFRETAI